MYVCVRLTHVIHICTHNPHMCYALSEQTRNENAFFDTGGDQRNVIKNSEDKVLLT